MSRGEYEKGDPFKRIRVVDDIEDLCPGPSNEDIAKARFRATRDQLDRIEQKLEHIKWALEMTCGIVSIYGTKALGDAEAIAKAVAAGDKKIEEKPPWPEEEK